MNIFIKVARTVCRWVNQYDDNYNFTCDNCGREVFDGVRICAKCKEELPWNDGAICQICGRKVGEEGVCLDCKEQRLVVEKARSAFLYEGEAMQLVFRLKDGERFLYRAHAEILHPFLEREFSDADLLAFVPMTKKATKRRGYNQSKLVAQELCKRTGKELIEGLEKIKESKAQKTLGKRERSENLKGCFRLTDGDNIKGKRVLLIDDTLTTGATSDEIARLLKKKGADKVYLLTLTSVPYKHPFGKQPKSK